MRRATLTFAEMRQNLLQQTDLRCRPIFDQSFRRREHVRSEHGFDMPTGVRGQRDSDRRDGLPPDESDDICHVKPIVVEHGAPLRAPRSTPETIDARKRCRVFFIIRHESCGSEARGQIDRDGRGSCRSSRLQVPDLLTKNVVRRSLAQTVRLALSKRHGAPTSTRRPSALSTRTSSQDPCERASPHSLFRTSSRTLLRRLVRVRGTSPRRVREEEDEERLKEQRVLR